MAKVLLVEDDNNLREIYQARLEAEGYDIASARDGEEALVVAKQEMPDLVISDVMMPKISGFEMLDILRNTDGLQHVKVIMLTALGQSEDQSRADSLGADRYLVKSQVTLEDIVNAAHDLLVESGAISAPPTAPAAPAPVAAAAPVAAPEPVATPVPEPAAVVDTPVIPLAAAPATAPEELPEQPLSMPPTPTTAPVEEETTPAPAPEPVAPAEPATPPTSDPQTEAEEQAAVESQIESFIETQPGTPEPEVAPAAATAPLAVEPETTQPETAAPAATSTTEEHDQVLNTALESLGTTAEAPAAATAAPAPAAEEAAPAEAETRKKVIAPLPNNDPSKKSLDDLLAAEEAAATPTTAPTAPKPAAPATPPAPGSDFDPNSIAL